MGVRRKETDLPQVHTPVSLGETDSEWTDPVLASIGDIMLENYQIRFEKFPDAMIGNVDRWLQYMHLPEDEKPKTFKQIFFNSLKEKTGELIQSGITDAIGKIVPFGDKVADFSINILKEYLSQPMIAPTGNAQKVAIHAELISVYENLRMIGSQKRLTFY